jgi:hypothetical protein
MHLGSRKDYRHETKDALPAERVYQVGQPIRWNPPRGAYTPKSMQALASGQTGIVERVYNDCYLLAAIAGWTGVLLNVDYVEAL